MYPETVNWLRVRTHFDAVMTARQLTQEQIATAGGLTGQNAISRLLTNHRRGPSVETFLRALDGLGMTPLQFFTDLATQGGTHDTAAASDGDRGSSDFAHLQRIIEANFADVQRRLDQLDAGDAADVVALPPARPSAAVRRRRRARRSTKVA